MKLRLLILSLFLMSELASAHGFHYQLKASTTLQTDAQNQLNEVVIAWQYDKEVTQMLLEGEDLSPAAREKTLATIRDNIMRDLYHLGYYTYLTLDKQPIAIKPATKANLTVDNGLLHLSFTLPLQTPINLMGKTASIELADPDETGILSFANAQQIQLASTLQSHCAVNVQKGNKALPPEAMTAAVTNQAVITCKP